LARPQRSVSAAVVTVIALVGLLTAGRWVQPRLHRETPVAPSTHPMPTSPVPTSPSVVTATRPPSSPGITKTADTALVDAIAVTPRSVWVAAGGLVLRLDPLTRRTVIVPDIETGQPPVVQVTVGAGAVWATTTAGRQLLRIDPRTARATASLSVPAEAVTADATGVWAVCCGAGGRGGRLTRVDPGGRVVKAIRLPGRPQAVGIGPSGVWVRGAEGPIWRVDPASNRVVATIRLPASNGQSYRSDTGDPGGDIVVTHDAVWVSNPATATVRRIDPRRNQVTDDMAEADGSDLTVAANGVVWATGGIRLLGLGVGSQVLGPRRDLHELGTDRITATAAARDGGLWLGTAQGLFHINRSVLRAG
jgi:streptogramin lyase